MSAVLPRWARLVDLVLLRVLPPSRSAEIVADLHERAGRRSSAVGRWYLRNASSLLYHYGMLRMSRALRRPRSEALLGVPRARRQAPTTESP
jgi:hypothetical protein